MPLVESAVVAIAVEVGTRGYGWIKNTSATANAPLQAAQAATEDTEFSPTDLRSAFARASEGSSQQNFVARSRDEIIADVVQELDPDVDVDRTQLVETYLDELENQLVEQGASGNAILLEYLRHIQEDLSDLRDDIRNSNYYRVFHHSESQTAIDYLQTQIEQVPKVEYVERPELPSQLAQKQLILGRKGTGKSRTLLHYTETTVQQTDIQSILIPSKAVQRSEDMQAAYTRNYDGDILLVWDDIHRLSRHGEQNVFYESILKLQDNLSDGQTLYVIGTCRSEEQQQLPHYDHWSEDRVWNDFERVSLRPLEGDTLEAIIKQAIDVYDLTFADDARQNFIDIVKTGSPSPFYINSACAFLRSWLNDDENRETVSNAAIADIPPIGVDIWEEQYERLCDEHEESRYLLIAIKLLDTVSSPILKPRVQGIYREVLDRNPIDFDRALQVLVDQQWVTSGSTTDQLQIHNIQLEAVNERIELYFKNFAEYLLSTAGQEIDTDVAVGLCLNLAMKVFTDPSQEDESLIQETAQKILDSELMEEIASPTKWMFHNNYSNYLHSNREYELALEQTTKAIQAVPSNPIGYLNHGITAEKLDEHTLAEGAWRRAIELASKTDEHDQSTVQVKFAKYLVRRGEDIEAKNLYEDAIQNSGRDPHIIQEYATFLERINQIGAARNWHKLAVETTNNIHVKLKYALFLQNHGPEDEFERVREEILRATPSNISGLGDLFELRKAHQRQFNPDTHNDPMIRDSEPYQVNQRTEEIAETEGPLEAAEWLEQRIEKYDSFPLPLYRTLGELYLKADDVERSVEAFKTGIEAGASSASPHQFRDYVIDASSLLEDEGMSERAVDLYDSGLDAIEGGTESARAAATQLARYRATLEPVDNEDSLIHPYALGRIHVLNGDLENASNCFFDVWQARDAVEDAELKARYSIQAGVMLLALSEMARELREEIPVADIREYVQQHITDAEEEIQQLYAEIQLQRNDPDPLYTRDELPALRSLDEIDADPDEYEFPDMAWENKAAAETVRSWLQDYWSARAQET